MTQTNEQTDEATNGQTEVRNRMGCIAALKCDIWWQYLNKFFLIID